MTTRRRIAIGGGAALLALVIAAIVAWVWWIPSAVRERVAAAAARRGLSASIGEVDVSFSDVVLRDVAIRSEPRGLAISSGRVKLDASLWDVATGGSAAVRAIELRDVRVELDMDAPALEDVLAALRPGEQDAGGTATDRTIRVEGLTVVLTDAHGAVVELTRGRASFESGRSARLSAGPLEIARGEPDGARAERVHLRLDAGEAGWMIGYASLGSVDIRYREREGEDRSPLWARLRRHTARLGSAVGAREPEDDRADAAEGGASDEPEEATAAPERTDEPGERDRAAAEGTSAPPEPSGEERAGARGEVGQAVADDAHEGTSAELFAQARELLGSRLGEGAVLELQGLSVTATAGREERVVLRELDAEVRALAEGRLRLAGSGRPGRGGRLGWRLTIDPDRLRAEGSLDFQRLPFVLVTPFLPALPWHQPEDTRMSGELSVEGRGAGQVHLDGEVSIEELALSSSRIAPSPVEHVTLGLAGEADVDPSARRLTLTQASVTLGGATAHLAGALEWPEDHYLVDLRATLPPTDCNVAVGAIPADLLAELAGFSFGGQIGGRIDVHVDSRDLDDTRLDIDVADGCRFLTAPALADVRRFEAPFVHRVLEPDGSVFEMETGPGTQAWTPIAEISPFLVHAVLGHEDGGFFGHPGFSIPSIRQALVRDLTEGRYVYGGSTITMQLVKNVFLHREKTLARKVQEVLLTWWVESILSKERILELYLNVIEYGPGIYGIRNAAQHYFGREPSDLGPGESAYLACILPDPKGFHSHWEDGSVPERFRRRVTRFLGTLGERHRYDAEAVAAGVAELGDLRFHRAGLPPPIPHSAQGGTPPLPLGATMDRAWEEALGPDDPTFDEDASDGADSAEDDF